MKILTVMAAFFALLCFTPAFAADKGHDHSGDDGQPVTQETASGIAGAACADVVKVTVNGMVCDFCARALEKVFGKRGEVSAIEVDLDHSLVSIAMKPGTMMDDALLTRLITDSGYDVGQIEKGC